MGQILAAGMAKLSSGYEAASEAMTQVQRPKRAMKLDQKLGLHFADRCALADVRFVGQRWMGWWPPFQVIAASNTTPKPSELAQGISMALVTTPRRVSGWPSPANRRIQHPEDAALQVDLRIGL